eukprot:scaffold29615_cov16-Prasinocladus_malaysianus.AAC.1
MDSLNCRSSAKWLLTTIAQFCLCMTGDWTCKHCNGQPRHPNSGPSAVHAGLQAPSRGSFDPESSGNNNSISGVGDIGDDDNEDEEDDELPNFSL